MRTVLISGAGIAGPTLAYWLAQNGFHVTVVERSQGLRSSGSPVDVRGHAVEVTGRMGVTARLREARTRVASLVFLNAAGRATGRIPIQTRAGDIELPRGDLASILYEAARDRAEFLFDESITGLAQDGSGVDVTLDRGGERRFDLVIGADGLHSAVRRLAFGPESDFARHIGVYVGGMPLDGETGGPDAVMYNTPGRAAGIHPSREKALAYFMFRAPAVPGFDYRDTAQHKRMLTGAFAGVGWRVPELLERVRASDDLYFDSVSRVRLPHWSRGRVALLGDAASCVSLFGDGSSMAIKGADTLATALASAPDDHETAFARYEQAHRRLVAPRQRGVVPASHLLIPSTRLGIATRNLATRLAPLLGAPRRN